MREARVFIGTERLGTIRQDQKGELELSYDPAYVSRRGATPLSLSMPLAQARHRGRVVQAFLWGLLPDNELVLARWGKEFGASPGNPLALLLHTGEDCAGAVRILPVDGAARGRRSDAVEWLDEDAVGTQIRVLRQTPTAWHLPGLDDRFSLAGAQTKTALLHRDGRWGVPQGSIPTTHILKPAITGRDDHDLNEHLCLRLAGELGLRAATSDIREFAGERVVVVERYDRAELPDGTMTRLHQEDFCQALGVLPMLKYQRDGGPSPRDIAALLRRASRRDGVERNVAEFVDGLIFNWLIAGTDAHAKNYSVLLRSREVVLAPLYDVASMLPYPHHLPKLRMAMKIGGSYRFEDVDRSRLSKLADEVGMEPTDVIARTEELADALPDAIGRVVSSAEVKMLSSDLPARLRHLLAARARRCTSRLKPSRSRTARPTTTRLHWDEERAHRLLGVLAERQRRVIEIVVRAGGAIRYDDALQQLGVESLRGQLGPITSALRRMQAAGTVPDGLEQPVHVDRGRVEVHRLVMHDEDRVAFAEALEGTSSWTQR